MLLEKSANSQFPSPHDRSAIPTATGSWFTRLFGCWHKEMSRPFTDHGQTYRSCVDCGARRQFNLRQWEMQGDFYYGLPSSKYLRRLNAAR